MSCAPLQHRFPQPSSQDDDLLSWNSIAAAVRNRAHALPASEKEELLGFADLLDGFTELEK